MVAYGRQRYWDMSDRDTGPPSRHRKMLSKTRTKYRRMMHKRGRRQSETDIKEQL